MVNEMKYLVVIFDRKLSLNAHIDYVCQRVSQLINQLSRSAKVYWGIGSGALRIIYKGATLPVLTYAAPIWHEALKKTYNTQKLQRVQRRILLRLIKGYRTISFEATCVIAGLTPIDIKIQEMVDVYETVKSQCVDGAFHMGPQCVMDTPIPAELRPHPSVSIDVQDEVQQASKYNIYTDGSKIDGKVGAGLVVYDEDDETQVYMQQMKLADWCSNNQAELLAIHKALEWLLQLEVESGQRKAKIMTDSQVSLRVIGNNGRTSEMGHAIRNKVNRLQSADMGWTLTITWIKPHAGHKGNEQADRLAKEAALSEDMDTCYCKVPISYVSEMARRKGVALWHWFSTWGTRTPGGSQWFTRGFAERKCVMADMYNE